MWNDYLKICAGDSQKQVVKDFLFKKARKSLLFWEMTVLHKIDLCRQLLLPKQFIQCIEIWTVKSRPHSCMFSFRPIVFF